VVRGNLGFSGLQQRRDLPGDLVSTVDVIDVPVATLDSLLADRRQRVRFVKMDLEGGEFHALQGATSILCDRPMVIFENGRERSANLYGYTSNDWFSLRYGGLHRVRSVRPSLLPRRLARGRIALLFYCRGARLGG
jgi:hypothetical protein